MKKRYGRLFQGALWSAAILVALGLVSGISWPAGEDDIEFRDVKKQTKDFIRYNKWISLSPEQELVRREALSEIRAPCCSNYSAYTCCCRCNMARTIWGLSKFLVGERGFGAEDVRKTVSEWIHFINPDGFSGDACFTGGCNRPFKNDGCGGMNESKAIWGGDPSARNQSAAARESRHGGSSS